MKKTMKIVRKVLLVLIVLAIVIGYTIYKYKNDENNKYDYTNSIYIMTKSTIGNGVNYYEINNDARKKITYNFETDEYIRYYFKDCYESNVEMVSGKILNEFHEDNCTMVDKDNNPFTLEGPLRDIINLTTRYVNPINEVSIYKINEHYYASISFDYRGRNPYKLYYYDKDNNKLLFIYSFENEDVIGIKEKDPFIFEEVKE